MEPFMSKFIEKGLIRLTMVQRIINEYISIAEVEEVKEVCSQLHLTIPSLLASQEGLEVACTTFTLADTKQRKEILKTIKEHVKELSTNKIGHLFLIHALNTLDDTTLAKKTMLNEIVSNFDTLIEDPIGQRIFIGILNNENTQTFTKDELRAFQAF